MMKDNRPVFFFIFGLVITLFIIPVYGLGMDSLQVPAPIWSDQTGNREVLVTCSADGRSIVSGSDSGILRMYEPTGKRLWTFQRNGKVVRSISVSGNGEYIGAVFLNPDAPSIYTDAEILFFNRSGHILWNYSRDYSVERIALSDDGNTIYVSGSPRLYSFDRTGTLVGQNESPGRTWVLASAADGSYAAAGGTVIEIIHSAGSQSPVNGMYSFGKDGTIIWNFPSNQEINSIAISPDGGTLVSAAHIHLYSLDRNGTLLWQDNSSSDFTSAAVSSEGELTVASTQFSVNAYNRTGSLLWKYPSDKGFFGIGLSDDGSVIVAGAADGLYVFDRTGKIVWRYGTLKSVLHVSVSRDGSYFAASTSDSTYFFNRHGDARIPIPDVPLAFSSVGAENNLTPSITVPGTRQPTPLSPILPVVAVGICVGALWKFIGKRGDEPR